MKTLETKFSVNKYPRNAPCFGRNDLWIADRNGLHQAHLINTFNHPQFSAKVFLMMLRFFGGFFPI